MFRLSVVLFGVHVIYQPSVCPAVVMVCLLRYAQVVEHSHHSWVNTSALVSGCTNALGLVMVGNFQVSEPTFAMLCLSFARSLSDCLCASGRSGQVAALRWGRRGLPSWAAVRLPPVCPHLPGGRDHPRLLDGPLQGGSDSGCFGLPHP